MQIFILAAAAAFWGKRANGLTLLFAVSGRAGGSLLSARRVSRLFAAGGGGLACLWLGGRGALPAESWQALTGYCLLWLLPLALRQGLWLLHALRHPAALHSQTEGLNRHFTRL